MESHYQLLADGRHLKIAGALMTDTAMFTCIAENEAGTTEQNFDVKILGERTELIINVLLLLECNNENVSIFQSLRGSRTQTSRRWLK